MKIGRLLFWFLDGDESLSTLNKNFFSLGILFTRLLNETYQGKKIKFINIDFSTARTYEMHPNLPVEEPYFYGGHIRYYGLFDKSNFEGLAFEEQKKYVWEKGAESLYKAAESIGNSELREATEFAYQKGLDINLNPNYRMIESHLRFLVNGLRPLSGSILDGMGCFLFSL